MKKLLALLLTLALPVGALADCVSMSMRWTLSPEGIGELIGAFSGGQRYPLVEAWLEELAPFVNGFCIVSAVDEDAGYGRVALRYQEEELLAFEAAATDAGTAMRYSWLPDTPLLLSPDNLYSMSAGALPRAWNAVDWEATLNAFRAMFTRWADAMESSGAAGSFAGDAYTGGSYRTTVRFDDRDLALLLDMLLDGPWPESFTALVSQPFLAAREETTQALSFLRREIRKAALNNRYRYELRLDEDDSGAPVGLSAIAYLEDRQVSILSVGRPAQRDTTMTYILGWGLRDTNFYLVAQTLEPDESGPILTATLLRDTTRQQSVKAIIDDPASILMQAACYDLSDGDTAVWKLSASGKATMNMGFDFTFSHASDANGSASSALIEVNGQRLLQVDLGYDYTQTLAAPDLSGLAPVDVPSLSQDEVIALFDDIDSSLDALMVRLFKLVPPKVITLPMNNRFLLPE